MNAVKAAPMSKEEVLLLIDLISANEIVNSKSTNATSNKLKVIAWRQIRDTFNSSVNSLPRTASQLRLKWENLKKAARKRCANIISSSMKSGDGKDSIPQDEVLDKVGALLEKSYMNAGNLEISEINDIDYTAEGYVGSANECEASTDYNTAKTTPLKVNNREFIPSGSNYLAKRRFKMDEEKTKARIIRDKAMTDYLISKKKKLDLQNEEKEMIISKLKIDLKNARLENMKLRSELQSKLFKNSV